MEDAWSPNAASYFKLEMLPMVEWKKVQNKNQVRIRIDNSYHLYRQMTHDSDIVLPEGWTRLAELSEYEHGSEFPKDFAHPSIQGQDSAILFL